MESPVNWTVSASNVACPNWSGSAQAQPTFIDRFVALPESKKKAFQDILDKIIAKDNALSILNEYRERILL